jgi:NAD(P)-dependent dehydrogenase (short-subunit alcohol dehydrogenase family)
MAVDTVIVTGAAGNLGSAVARELAGRGARLVCVDRSADGLDKLAATLPPGAEAIFLPGLDLTDPQAGASMAAQALEHYGAITGLANTVGGYRSGRVVDDPVALWDQMMALNARTALVTSAAVLPAMVSAGYGRIVHVSAQPALKSVAGLAAYAASKAAALRLVESIAAEHRADGISANCILPSTIDTPQNRAAMPTARTDAWVSPEAIAKLFAFLLSPEGGVVTGGAIPATGSGNAAGNPGPNRTAVPG